MSLTSYPGAIDSFINKQDNIDYVLAAHVNFLQDAVDAIQIVLGINPHGVATDVKTRLDNHEAGGDHDTRYGGLGWNSTDNKTIKGHAHDDVDSNPSKISLANHVTGTLPRQNIILSGTNALRGDNIELSSGNNTKITTALGQKLSTTGGTLTGNLTAPVFISNVAQNTAPLQVSSNTQVNNLNANFIMGKRVHVQAAAPGTATAGDIWIDTA